MWLRLYFPVNDKLVLQNLYKLLFTMGYLVRQVSAEHSKQKPEMRGVEIVNNYTYLLKSFAFKKSKGNEGSRDFIVDVSCFYFLRWKM